MDRNGEQLIAMDMLSQTIAYGQGTTTCSPDTIHESIHEVLTRKGLDCCTQNVSYQLGKIKGCAFHDSKWISEVLIENWRQMEKNYFELRN